MTEPNEANTGAIGPLIPESRCNRNLGMAKKQRSCSGPTPRIVRSAPDNYFNSDPNNRISICPGPHRFPDLRATGPLIRVCPACLTWKLRSGIRFSAVPISLPPPRCNPPPSLPDNRISFDPPSTARLFPRYFPPVPRIFGRVCVVALLQDQ